MSYHGNKVWWNNTVLSYLLIWSSRVTVRKTSFCELPKSNYQQSWLLFASQLKQHNYIIHLEHKHEKFTEANRCRNHLLQDVVKLHLQEILSDENRQLVDYWPVQNAQQLQQQLTSTLSTHNEMSLKRCWDDDYELTDFLAWDSR